MWFATCGRSGQMRSRSWLWVRVILGISIVGPVACGGSSRKPDGGGRDGGQEPRGCESPGEAAGEASAEQAAEASGESGADAPGEPTPGTCAADADCPGAFCVGGSCKPRPEWKPGVKLPGAYPADGNNDWTPTLRGDDLELVFVSDRAGGSGGYDLWRATRAARSDAFGGAANLGPTVNTAGDEIMPSLRKDSLELFYSADGVAGSSPKKSIYRASQTATDAAWGAGAPVSELNAAERDWGPSLLADGLTLVLASDRPGGVGGMDLYQATRSTDTLPFGTPTPVPGVNTSWEQYSGAISPDGRYIVLTYAGVGAMGLADLRIAVRPSGTGAFSIPETLGELDGPSREMHPFISRDGRFLYYSYNPDDASATVFEIRVAERK